MMEILCFSGVIGLFLLLIEWKYKYVSKNKKEVIFMVVLGSMAFLMFFNKIIFGDYQLSFTNLMYAKAPFNSLDVAVSGRKLSDPIDQFIPYIYEIFTEGNLLLWSSSTIFGMPVILGNFLLNPMNIGYTFGLEIGQLLQYVLKYSAAFIGMYMFLKNLKFHTYAVYAGAITYTFSSVMAMWGGWPHSDVTAIAPFLFYAIDKLIMIYQSRSSENKVKYYLLFIVGLYMMLIAGMPTYVAYFLYFGVIYTIFRLWNTFDWKKDMAVMLCFLISVGIAIIFAALLSMPYLVELYSQVSEYAEGRLAQSFSTLEWSYILGFFFPYASNGSIHLNECSVFAGYTFMFFFLLTPLYYKCLNKMQKKEIIFWGSCFIVLFCLVFMEWSGYIYQFFPLINTSLKIRVIVLMNFVCAMLTAWVVQYLQEFKGKIKGIVIALIPLVICICSIAYIIKKNQIKSVLVWFGLTGVFCLYMIVKNQKWQKIIMIGILFAITVDVVDFANNTMPLISDEVEAIPEATDSIEYLQEATSDGERIISAGSWVLFAASNIFYDIDTITGHGFINTNEDVSTYLETIDPSIASTSTMTNVSSVYELENYSLLAYASVSHLYYQCKVESFAERIAESPARGTEKIVIDDMIIEELEDCSPRAFIATDVISTRTLDDALELMSEEYLENTAFVTYDIYDKYEFQISDDTEANQVLSYEDCDDEVYITVQTTGGNMLVLNDYYYDGWTAYINGEEVEIEKVNYLFRGIYLEEAGEYEIVFKYFPTSVVVEWCIYGIMVFLVLLIVIFRKKINALLSSGYDNLSKIEPLTWKIYPKNIVLTIVATVLITGIYMSFCSNNEEAGIERISIYPDNVIEEMNVEMDGTNYVATSTDPHIIFESIEEEIKWIEIELTEPIESDTVAAVYYSDTGVFLEDYRVEVGVSQGTQFIRLELGLVSEDVLKIDIGNTEGFEFGIDSIQLVVAGETYTSIVALLALLISYLVIEFRQIMKIFRKQNKSKREEKIEGTKDEHH